MNEDTITILFLLAVVGIIVYYEFIKEPAFIGPVIPDWAQNMGH